MGKYNMAGKRPKRFKWLRRFAIALVLYGLIGFFIVPAVIKWQMLKRLPGLTKRQAAVRQVKFNPFAISLTIRGFSLKEPDGQVFSSFDEFYLNFNPLASVFRWSPVFKDISLVKPFGQITFLAGGKFNFSNLFEGQPPATPPPPSTPGPPPRIYIDHLTISNGLISLDDLSGTEAFHSEFGPVNFNLTNFTTVRDKNSPYAFMARTDSGETFAWSGSVGVNPPRSAGIFRLAGLKFGKYTHYSHDYSRFVIAGGNVEVAADYHFDSGSNALDLQVSNAAIHLTGLELKSPDTDETVISIPALAITGAEADLLRQTARIGLIKSSGGSFLVRQEKDGVLNLISLLILPTNAPAKVEPPTNTPASAPPAAWKAKIDEIAFDDYAIRIEDKMPGKPARFDVDQIGFNLKGISNATNAPVTASLSLRYQGSGFVAVNGTATLLPPSADLQINVTNVDLRPIQPYVEGQVKLALTGGALDLHGRAQYASREAGAPLVDFTGNLVLNRFATTDDVLFKDFTKWDSFSVDGIKLDLQPDQFHADQVKFTGLSTSLAIGPDRRVNLQTILQNQLGNTNAATNAVAVAAAPPSTAPAKNIPMTVDAFVLENASLHYSDESLEPHCNFDVQELNGSIKGLSSDPNATATVDFQGRVDARSPFSITGKINPLSTNLFVDITVAFTNTELTAFSPYAEKFVGRPLEKGKLSFGVHYFIENKALKAENGFYVDQLTLGAKNNSPDATSLPVKLAIALLKDRNGRIQLDVPVTGRIDDPKFRVWPIIWHVVENLLVKAATSPFSLLGAAFGGGGEELSFVEFEPGSVDLAETETKKLDTLAKALFERPALSLEINGSVDPVADHLPIARLKLEQRLKTLYVKELTDSGKPAVSIDQVNLDPDEHARLLKKVYQATLGNYEPTPVSTNAASGVDTNSIAARLAAMPKKSSDNHGASQLMTPWKKKTPATTTTAPTAASRQTAPAVPLTRTELELADREDQLMRQMQITGDDLRELMQRRATQVQTYLLKTEKVTVDRLFITVPKTVDASFKGQDRANLSLD